MDLKQYFALFRRWAWLLILGLVLGATAGYFGSRYQTPVYRASTRILVTRAPQDKASDMTYLSDQQLTQTYVQLLTTQPVLDSASQRLGFEIDPELVRVQSITNTQIIQLTFEDSDPQHGAAVANTLVEVLIGQNENLQAGRYATTEESLQAQLNQIQDQINTLQSQIENASSQVVQDQLAQVQEQITSLQSEIAGLEQDILVLSPPPTPGRSSSPAEELSPEDQYALNEKQARLAQIRPVLTLYQQVYTNLVVLGEPVTNGNGSDGTHLSQLQTTLGLYQQIYINLLNNLETVKLARLQNTPNVVQIEPALPPEEPIRPRPLMNTLLAGAIGFLLVVGIAFLVEYLDDTLKTPEEIERILGLSVIGYVAKMDYPAGTPRGMFVVKQPRSPVAEAFRSLRTNLEFSSVDTPLRTILVTSPNPGEGKTTIAVNLAGIIAQGGKSVILLDTDMRRPQVHQFFDLPNRLGFSELFRNNLPFRAVGQEMEGLKDAVVIPSGNPPPNPTELLSSNRMTQVLDQLKAAVDVVVLDSPPSMVADAQVLASKVDGVILIIHPAHTHADAALASVDQMKRAGARILGVVLNRIPRNHSSYYGGYRYYLPYYNHYQPAPKEPAATRTKKSGLQPRKRLQVLSGFFKGLSTWMANRRARTPRLSRFSLTGRSAGLFSGKSKVN